MLKKTVMLFLAVILLVGASAGFAAEAVAGIKAWPKLSLFTWSYMTLEDNMK